MMKKIVMMIGVMVMVIGLTGCGADRNEAGNEFRESLLEITPLKFNEDLTGIELELLDGGRTVSYALITLQLVNNTEYTIIYGEYFSIEFYDAGEWKVVPFPENTGFFLIAYHLESGEVTSITRQLEWLFPDGLPTGRYRFRTHVFRDIDTPIRDHNLHDLVAEFNIQ